MRLRASSSTPNSTQALADPVDSSNSNRLRQSSDLPGSSTKNNESKPRSIDIQPLFNKLQRNYLDRGTWYILSETDCSLSDLMNQPSLLRLGQMSSATDGKRKFEYNTTLIAKDELCRQEILYELLVTERDFVADLEMIQEVWTKYLNGLILPFVSVYQVE